MRRSGVRSPSAPPIPEQLRRQAAPQRADQRRRAAFLFAVAALTRFGGLALFTALGRRAGLALPADCGRFGLDRVAAFAAFLSLAGATEPPWAASTLPVSKNS